MEVIQRNTTHEARNTSKGDSNSERHASNSERLAEVSVLTYQKESTYFQEGKPVFNISIVY